MREVRPTSILTSGKNRVKHGCSSLPRSVFLDELVVQIVTAKKIHQTSAFAAQISPVTL